MRHQGKAESGFTLIEFVVVLVILALAAGIAVVSFDVIYSRQLDSTAQKMVTWFESVAETAVFQSAVIGVREEAGSLVVVAYYDNRWYEMNGIEPFGFPENIQWQVDTENEIRFADELEDDALEPFVAFLPSGQAMPEGSLSLTREGVRPETLRWNESATFSFEDNLTEGSSQ